MKIRKNILIFFIIMLIFISSGCKNNNNNEEEKKINSNAGVTLEQVIDGFRIENVSISVEKGISKYIGNITNIDSNILYVKKIKVTMKNEEGKTITSVDINMDRDIKKNETVEFSAVFWLDLKDVSEINYNVVK